MILLGHLLAHCFFVLSHYPFYIPHHIFPQRLPPYRPLVYSIISHQPTLFVAELSGLRDRLYRYTREFSWLVQLRAKPSFQTDFS